MRIAILALAVILSVATIPLGGCNAVSDAQKAQAVIGAVISVAQAETPLIPAADQAGYSSLWGAVGTLNGALGTCITGVSGIMGKGAKVSACFTTFANAFLQNLSQFRIVNPNTQKKVSLYVAGISAALQIIIAFTTPVSSPTAAPSSQELHDLGIQAGLTPRELAQAGL